MERTNVIIDASGGWSLIWILAKIPKKKDLTSIFSGFKFILPMEVYSKLITVLDTRLPNNGEKLKKRLRWLINTHIILAKSTIKECGLKTGDRLLWTGDSINADLPRYPNDTVPYFIRPGTIISTMYILSEFKEVVDSLYGEENEFNKDWRDLDECRRLKLHIILGYPELDALKLT